MVGSADPGGSAHAVWFPRRGAVELRSEPIPDVGPGDVRVRAIVSGLSHGTEMLVFRGQVPAGLALDLPTLRGGFNFPIKYGYANVGRVVETGAGVQDTKRGDLVFALHPHQTEYVLPMALAVPLPADLDPELGVFLANLETAVNVVLDAAPRLGERVLIFGQGVVGLLLTQLVRQAGASRVFVVDPVAVRRELAMQVGADRAFTSDADVAGSVRELTEGVGADLVLEASGNGAALSQALDCVAFQGTIVVCSWYGTKEVRLPLGDAFHRRRLRLVSSQVGTIDPSLQPRWTHARRLQMARDELTRLTLRALITHRVPFEEAARAYRLVDEQAEETVQVVLTYGS
jgi:2-desacetyl-2-hydroxyethyl bacteriochlorophyllide A dehydrogenase